MFSSCGETERGVIAGVRHGNHDVGFDRKFSRQLAAHLGADLADVYAADDAVGPRKIDVFEHAEGRLLIRERPFRAQTVLIDDQDFAGLDLANELRVNQIQRARFRRQYVGAIEFAEASGRQPNGSRTRDQFALAHDQQRKRAFNPAQRRENVSAIVRGLRQEMQNDFAVGGGLENGSFSLQFVAQQIGVDQIAVVRDRHLAAHAVDHEGLRVFDRAGAGGGITRVPDRACPFQFGQFFLTKYLRHKTHVLVLEKCRAGPVAGDDSRALLAAMLQRKQAVICQDRRVRMAEHAEESALVLRERTDLAPRSMSILSGDDHTQIIHQIVRGSIDIVRRQTVSQMKPETRIATIVTFWVRTRKRCCYRVS